MLQANIERIKTDHEVTCAHTVTIISIIPL